ncbi:MAG: hypothetical protein LBO66_13765 [Deltaproteobacteria bacterium]|nr:hypothetical protein [Deltaproteobacteria bacterium]
MAAMTCVLPDNFNQWGLVVVGYEGIGLSVANLALDGGFERQEPDGDEWLRSPLDDVFEYIGQLANEYAEKREEKE